MFRSAKPTSVVVLADFNFVQDVKALYDMCTDKEGAYVNVSRHRTSYRDAIEPNGPIKPDVLEQVRGQYSGDESRWVREMEAEFADDDDRWIPMSLIMKCICPRSKTYSGRGSL